MIKLPAGLTVTSITPRSVHVAFQKRVDKIVEVVPTLVGHPLHGYVVSEVKAVPTTVRARGAEGTLAALTTVRTVELPLEGRADSFTTEAQLAPPQGVTLASTAPVTVAVHIEEELVTRRLGQLAVVPAAEGLDPTRWQVSPAKVDLTLTGALLEVEKAIAAGVHPIATPIAGGGPRGGEVAVVVEGLPPGVGVRITPPRVRVAPRTR
jgi:YbbR domain-containing protein